MMDKIEAGEGAIFFALFFFQLFMNLFVKCEEERRFRFFF